MSLFNWCWFGIFKTGFLTFIYSPKKLLPVKSFKLIKSIRWNELFFFDIFCTKGLFWFRKFDNDTSRLYSNLHNYFNIHICPFLCSLPYCCLSILSCFQFLQFYQKMGLTKFALFVFRVKNVHFWLPSQCTPRVSEVRQSLATYAHYFVRLGEAELRILKLTLIFYHLTMSVSSSCVY